MAPDLRRPLTRIAGDEDEASGFASMVAELVGANVAESRGRAFASRLARGDVVLTATDNEQSVMVSFKPGEIVVSDEARSEAPAMSGSWIVLAGVCTGSRSPFDAMRKREVQVSRWTRPDLLAVAGYVLSAPRVEPLDRRTAAIVLLIALVTLLLFVAVRLHS